MAYDGGGPLQLSIAAVPPNLFELFFQRGRFFGNDAYEKITIQTKETKSER